MQRRCSLAERELCSKEMALKDAHESCVSEASLPPTSTTDELSLDISVCIIKHRSTWTYLFPNRLCFVYALSMVSVVSEDSRANKRKGSLVRKALLYHK